MSTLIPADVWLEIVKNITVRQDVHNLSLTCRVTRDLALPVLFRALSFDASHHPKTALQSFLTGSSQRAESLLDHPHLLVHVLEVHVSLRKPARGTLWRDTNEKISTTISALPRIQKLYLELCIITPSLHEAIYGKPSLRSLEIHYTEVSPLLRPQSFSGLTRLSYRSTSSLCSSWFMQLLDCCLSTLISLTLDDGEVFAHLLSISRRQPLALRTLAVCYNFPESSQRVFWNLSIMCPELRTLRLPPFFDFTFPDHAIPKLEFAEGSPSTLNSLISGRSIHTVNITNTNINSPTYPISPGDAILLRAGKAPVRHLTVTKFRPFKSGGFKLLAAAFGDLLSLSLAVMFDYRSYGDIEASLHSVTENLSQWPQLQVYRIISKESFAQKLSKKYSQFPLAPSGDPSNRGHPSLTEFQFMGTLAWLWFPAEGWTLREVDGRQFPCIPEEGLYKVSRYTIVARPFYSRFVLEFLESSGRYC